MVAIPKLSDDLEKDIVHSILSVTSRPVTITYVQTRDTCPVCGGTDPFCSTCNGNPTVDVEVTETIQAKIKWAGSDQKKYTPTGQYPEGDCLVTIPTTEDGNIMPTESWLEKILYVTIDGRRCVVDKWYFRGNPINRVYLVVNQDTNSRQRIG